MTRPRSTRCAWCNQPGPRLDHVHGRELLRQARGRARQLRRWAPTLCRPYLGPFFPLITGEVGLAKPQVRVAQPCEGAAAAAQRTA